MKPVALRHLTIEVVYNSTYMQFDLHSLLHAILGNHSPFISLQSRNSERLPVLSSSTSPVPCTVNEHLARPLCLVAGSSAERQAPSFQQSSDAFPASQCPALPICHEEWVSSYVYKGSLSVWLPFAYLPFHLLVRPLHRICRLPHISDLWSYVRPRNRPTQPNQHACAFYPAPRVTHSVLIDD